jgi:hypothetical protein
VGACPPAKRFATECSMTSACRLREALTSRYQTRPAMMMASQSRRRRDRLAPLCTGEGTAAWWAPGSVGELLTMSPLTGEEASLAAGLRAWTSTEVAVCWRRRAEETRVGVARVIASVGGVGNRAERAQIFEDNTIQGLASDASTVYNNERYKDHQAGDVNVLRRSSDFLPDPRLGSADGTCSCSDEPDVLGRVGLCEARRVYSGFSDAEREMTEVIEAPRLGSARRAATSRCTLRSGRTTTTGTGECSSMYLRAFSPMADPQVFLPTSRSTP